MMLSGNISDTDKHITMILNGEMNCIACGDKIEENSYACKCGHVHETERKWIRGKRYSVYREELYSKLTVQELQQKHNKRQKTKPKSEMQIQKISPKKQTRRKSKYAKSPKRRKNQYGSQLRHAYSTSADAGHSHKNSEKFKDNSENSCPTRWNFEFALEDINRRFLKQSLFWIRL